MSLKYANLKGIENHKNREQRKPRLHFFTPQKVNKQNVK